MKKVRIHKEGIYTHVEMNGAYMQGYEAGYNDRKREMKKDKIILNSEVGKPLAQVSYEREVYRFCMEKWLNASSFKRRYWNIKGKLKKISGFHLFLAECERRKGRI